MGRSGADDARTNASRKGRPRASAWERWRDEELLSLRFCDLGVRIAGTVLEERIAAVLDELKRRGIRFRPHFWLSSEWFTPDGVPGVAIPFYLAHPRLMELEERQMLEVEGGTHKACMQILRHEIGHAIDNAYQLHRRPDWLATFGAATQRYPDYYQPKPYSKRFVLHLDSWYAQSHPSEDFAETFAVWLTPSSQWRKRYAGWPALKKLEYVDRLMAEIAGRRPVRARRREVDPLGRMRTTLRKHYRKKRARYGAEHPDFYDRDLLRLFSRAPEHAGQPLAAAFLRRIRPELRRLVARWTGEYQYTIDQVLREMIERCRELRLRVAAPEAQTTMEATILLTVQTMNYLHSGRHRLVL